MERSLRTTILPQLQCDNHFTHIYYLPVEKRRFKHIRIELTDLTGTPAFSRRLTGVSATIPVKVVLHFRRVPT